jgi:hypothetical protein
MRKTTMTALAFLFSTAICCLALAQGQAPPPGWGQPAPLPPANGEGQVTFNHGGTALALPLNKIEIDTSTPDLILVSLTYVDGKQENKLQLSFGSMPKLGKNDPHPISGFVVETKARGRFQSRCGTSSRQDPDFEVDIGCLRAPNTRHTCSVHAPLRASVAGGPGGIPTP